MECFYKALTDSFDLMKGCRVLKMEVYVFYSQFEQRVKRGEGIQVDPLDNIAAQIPENSQMERNCNLHHH